MRRTTKKENILLLTLMLLINAYAFFNPSNFINKTSGYTIPDYIVVATMASWLALGFSLAASELFLRKPNENQPQKTRKIP